MDDGQIKKRFLLIMLAFVISSASIILIPFSINSDGNLSVLGYVTGVMFWAGLLSGAVGYMLLGKKADIKSEEDESRKNIPDVLRFFSNTPARIMDGLLIIGVIGTIYCAANVKTNQVIATFFLLFSVTGIYAHVLFNGKIYQYIWKNTKGTLDALDENEGGM